MGNRVELDEMGKKILDASRTELYLSMRFLGPALHSLGFIMDLSTTTVGTDAAYIRFNPNYLFRLYVDRPRLLNRTYMHILLHCVFRHMFTARGKEDRELWDLASDIAVDYVLDSMEYSAVAELTPEFRQRVYDRLEAEVRVLTAERIYQYFIERKRNYLEELQLRAAFALCDHSFWERMEDDQDKEGERADSETPDRDNPEDKESEKEKDPDRRKDPSSQEQTPGGEDSGKKEPDGKEAGKKDPEGKDTGKKDSGGKDPDPKTANQKSQEKKSGGRDSEKQDPQKQNSGDNGPRKETEKKIPRLKKTSEELEGEWKETSRRMEAEILASGKEASEESGSLERILSISNRRRTDYREFLRKFAILREVASVDPDSFDYGFYYYGLEIYGNMPLIEENEYREVNKIRTLVIAIDTSASCQDTLVQRFINETAAVLRSIGSFFDSCEVHIIECDEHVQKEIIVRKPEELEKYAREFHVKGGYGTDFRPVFSYVEEKRRTGEIKDLEGLMYFTDGMGTYPEKPTDYDTAFVFFNDEEMDDAKVPDWAVRLYIEGEKVRQLRF